MPNEPTLGGELSKLLDGISDLIEKEQNYDNLVRLREQQKVVIRKMRKLIDGNVKKDTEIYANVVANLKEANSKIKKAKAEIEKVADAIEKIATVISWLSKAAAAAA